LTIDGVHTYFVQAGSSFILTHNSCGKNNKSFTFENNPKHKIVKSGKANPAPTNGQKALDPSVELPGNTTRRIAVDSDANEFVVFDEHI